MKAKKVSWASSKGQSECLQYRLMPEGTRDSNSFLCVFHLAQESFQLQSLLILIGFRIWISCSSWTWDTLLLLTDLIHALSCLQGAFARRTSLFPPSLLCWLLGCSFVWLSIHNQPFPLLMLLSYILLFPKLYYNYLLFFYLFWEFLKCRRLWKGLCCIPNSVTW